MRGLRRTLLVLAIATAGSQARSQPFTSGLDAVAGAVAARAATLTGDLTGDEVKQKRALDRALKALSRPSRSVERDLALAAVLSKILDEGFPGDGTFGPALDGAIAGFRSDLSSLLTRVSALVGTLPDWSARDRASAGVAAAYDLVDIADAASARAERARILGRALKTACAAVRPAIAKSLDIHGADARDLRFGVGDVSETIDGVPIDSVVSLGVFFPRTGVFFLAGIDVQDLVPGESRGVILIMGGMHGPGDYTLTVVNEVAMGQVMECPSTYYCDGYGTRASGPDIGTLHLTTFDMERRLAEGTFSFTAAGGGSGTRTVTNGSFRVGLAFRR